MNKTNKHQISSAKKPGVISLRIRIALAASLAIISIFPIFITFAPQEWPLQQRVIVLDIIYLLILAGYVPVIFGLSRSRWLFGTVSIVSIIGLLGMAWLVVTISTLNIDTHL